VPTHVVERSAIGRNRIGLFVDILERDVVGTDRRNELVSLPSITDEAARVVPDNKATPDMVFCYGFWERSMRWPRGIKSY
jgi:hypothetical protein